VFRAAFEDELKRFDNSGTHHSDKWPCEHCAALDPDYMKKGPPKVNRAKLFSDLSTQPSRGVGIGQQTGGTAQSDAEEAQRILGMILCDMDDIEDCCGARACGIIRDLRTSLSFGKESFRVTGKQLFALRDIHSKLIEKGLV
jgi:hypothetical protein